MNLEDADTSYRRPYVAPPAASRMAGLRFGNTRDVVVLWNGDDEEVSEYFRGLIFIGTVTALMFLTWGLLLCIFMCMGKDRVGFLSGRPFSRDLTPPPLSPKQQTQEQQENKRPYKSGDPWNSTATRSRVVFLFSGLVVITFSILLVTRGLTQLQTTVDTVHASSIVVQKITVEGQDIIANGLRDLRSRAASVRSTLLNELDRDIFCPGDPSMENSEYGPEVRKQVDSAVTMLEELENFQDGRLADFEESLLNVHDAANSVEETSNETDFLGWKSMILLIPYTIITALLMSACVMAFFDVSFSGLTCLINWFLLPIFVIMTTGACVLAALTALAAGVNSDFCLPGGKSSASPDENVVGIMLAEGYKEDDFELQMVRYFVEQCTSEENPFAPLSAYLPELKDIQFVLDEVVTFLRDGGRLAELSLYCNREFNALDLQIDNMNVILAVLTDSLTRLLDLVSCHRIVPIYTDTIYDASCEYSTKALFWIFCCAIILGTFGLLMITLRASFKLSIDCTPESFVQPKDRSKNRGGNDEFREPSQRDSSERPVHATPYDSAYHSPREENPTDEVRADDSHNDGSDTAYTAPNETADSTYPTRGSHNRDDDTVTREKKANAVDID